MSEGEAMLLKLLEATDVDGGCDDVALKSALQDWFKENGKGGYRQMKTIELGEGRDIRVDWWLDGEDVEGIFTGRYHKQDRGPREDGQTFVDWLAEQIGFDLYLDTK